MANEDDEIVYVRFYDHGGYDVGFMEATAREYKESVAGNRSQSEVVFPVPLQSYDEWNEAHATINRIEDDWRTRRDAIELILPPPNED